MKKVLLLFVILLNAMTMMAQAPQKPSIMVLPDREWCLRNGCTTLGEPDVAKALSNTDFSACVIQFSGMMAERQYPLKDASSVLESVAAGKAKRMVMTGKNGQSIKESDEDMLSRAANVDIKVRFDIITSNRAGINQVEFHVKAVDAATDEMIWAENFAPIKTSAPSSAVLAQAVAGKMDSFCEALQKHFDRIQAEGRKCYIEFNVAENYSNFDLESEYEAPDGEDYELSDIIVAYLQDKAVNKALTPMSKDTDVLGVEVNIPLFGKDMLGNMVSINAEQFVKGLNKPLFKSRNIDMKTTIMGQGKAYIMLSPRSENEK